jgi:hypothetical protein
MPSILSASVSPVDEAPAAAAVAPTEPPAAPEAPKAKVYDFGLRKGHLRPQDLVFAAFVYAGAKQLRHWSDDELVTEADYDAAIAAFENITLG